MIMQMMKIEVKFDEKILSHFGYTLSQNFKQSYQKLYSPKNKIKIIFAKFNTLFI